MEEKISSLKSFDEKKIKKMASDREAWLNTGDDILINPSYKTNMMALELNPKEIYVHVKEIIQENDNYKTLVLNSIRGNEMPKFRAGQKISLIVEIDGKKYTRPFSISSSPSSITSGEYNITVGNSDDVVNSYLFNEVTEGEKLAVSSPFGEFFYEPLRDKENIIAIASDEGIIPIFSMIQSVIDGIENYKLTVFYSVKYEKDLLFKKKLLEYREKSSKVKINILLSEEKKTGFMSGFASIDKIKRVYSVGDTSIFIAGSEGLLKYLDKELTELKVPKKFIRYDNFLPRCNIRKVVKYNLGIYIDAEKYEIPCYNNKTIMRAIEESGIYIPNKCQNGSCGFCRSELVMGEVKIVNDKRTMADKKYNYIHPCSTYPKSDIEIVVR